MSPRRRGDKEAIQGPIIAYRYYHHDELVNIKFRHVREKKFYSVPLQQKALYGLDHVHAAFVCSCGCKTEPAKNGRRTACSCTKQVIIVEGEMDKLALYEAGVHNAVSVPNGAAGAVAKPRQQDAGGAGAKEAPPPATEDEDTNRGFSYIWAAKDLLKEATQVVIATDNDVAGQALSEELARRLGRERCWLVDFGNAGLDGEGGDDAQAGERPSHSCKDANEVLMKLGADGLVETIQSATQYPIQGIKTFRDFYHEILAFYRMEPGDDNFGLSSGWETLDEYYKVVPGELTIVTGVPNSGKSEWIDALAVRLHNGAPSERRSPERAPAPAPCRLAADEPGFKKRLEVCDVLHGEPGPGPLPQAVREAHRTSVLQAAWLHDGAHVFRRTWARDDVSGQTLCAAAPRA